jgi:DNA-binding SARP family transcriptional activator
MEPVIRLRLLGPVSLRGSNGREMLSVRPKGLALLAYLAVGGTDRLHRRDTLLCLFWPELDQEHARHALRQVLHTLRRTIGRDALRCRGSEEVGIDPGRLHCDVTAFVRRLRRGEALRALKLYQGDLLAGFHLRGAAGFEHWLNRERERLRSMAAAAAWEVAQADEARGNTAAAAWHVRRAAELSPDDEEAVRRVMDFHARIGDRPGALRTYERFAIEMRSSWGVEPSAPTEALARRICAEAGEPVAAAEPAEWEG